jgi:hypothetical protein
MGMLCWFWKPYAEEEEGVFGKVLEGASRKMVFSPILRDLAHKYELTNTKIMGT